MRAELFSDTFYHGQNHIEFDPAQVVLCEERTERLFLRSSHAVTQITLESGVPDNSPTIALQVLAGRSEAQNNAFSVLVVL